VIAAIGSGMAILSWRKWPDILIDFGRELYVPWQLSQGSRLYLDIAYFNGPFSSYVNSLIFKIFGASLMTIAIFNLSIIVAITLLIFLIFREMADVIVATIVASAFLGIFAFCQYHVVGNFNFVTPYSHELTHGVLLSFWTLFSFLSYLKKRSYLWLASIGFGMGIAFLTKIEVFLAISLAMITGFLWVMIIDRPSLGKIWKRVFILIVSFLLPLAIFWAYFAEYVPANKAFVLVTTPYRTLSETSLFSSPYYLRVTGMNVPLLNLKKLLISLGWNLLGLFLYLLLPAYLVVKIIDKKLQICAMVCILLIMIFSIPYLRQLVPWMEILRALPLLMVGIIIYSFRKLRIDIKMKKLDIPLILVHVFAVFSFVFTWKIILKTHVQLYGFALAMPATLMAIFLLLSPLANRVAEKFGNVVFVRVLSIMIVGIIVLVHIQFSYDRYSDKTLSVGSKENRIITWAPDVSEKGAIFNKALEKIGEVIRREENFIALPEGIMLNFLAKRKNPSPYVNFMPPELIIFGEDQMITAFRESAPNYVLLVDRDTSTYGYRYFGRDYGNKLFQWVQENYKPLCTIGNQPFSGKGFGIVIAKRANGPQNHNYYGEQ